MAPQQLVLADDSLRQPHLHLTQDLELLINQLMKMKIVNCNKDIGQAALLMSP
jgi:hypothetical protein